MKKLFILTIFFTFQLANNCFAQSVDYASGTGNISIPLYTMKGESQTFPISLNYNTQGVAVNQTASWVGLGWELMGGGQVSRVINGIRDEKQRDQESSDIGYMWGGTIGLNPLTENFDPTQINVEDLAMARLDYQPDEFFISAPGLSGHFVFGINESQLNETPSCPIVFRPYQDLKVEYTINNSQITSFIVTNSMGLRYYFDFAEETEFNMEFRDQGNTLMSSTSFKAVNVWHLTRIENANNVIEIEYGYSQNALSSEEIFLSQTHSYTDGYQTSSSIHSGEIQTSSPDYYCPGSTWLMHCKTSARTKITHLNFIQTTSGRLDFHSITPRTDLLNDVCLDAITLKINENLVSEYRFVYSSFENPSIIIESGRLRLDEIQLFNGNSQSMSNPITFEYEPGKLPFYNDVDQDYWGYSNREPIVGVDSLGNKSLIPFLKQDNLYTPWFNNKEPNLEWCKVGVLNKVNYSDGGYVMYEYELHEYSSNNTNQPLMSSATFDLIAEATAYQTIQGTEEQDSFFDANQGESLRISIELCPTCTFTDNNRPSFQFFRLTQGPSNVVWTDITNELIPDVDGLLELNQNIFRNPDIQFDWDVVIPNGLSDTQVSFAIRVKSYPEYASSSQYKIRAEIWKMTPPEIVEKKLAGGLRVKRISVSDGDLNHTNDIVQEFEYTSESGGESSGILLSNNEFHFTSYNDVTYFTQAEFYIALDWCSNPCTYFYTNDYNCLYHHISSSSIRPINAALSSTPVMYQKVKVALMSNGSNAGYTIFDYNYNDLRNYSNYPSGPEVSKFWRNGELAKQSIFDENGTLLKEKIYEYESRPLAGSNHVPGLVAASEGTNGVYQLVLGHAEQCVPGFDPEEMLLNNILAATVYMPNSGLSCFGGPIVSYIANVIIQSTSDCTETYTDNTHNHYSSTNYQYETEWYYLKNEITRQYNDFNVIEDKVSFTYEGNGHVAPTKEEVSRIGDPIMEYTIIKYSGDYQISNSLPGSFGRAIERMQNKGMKKIPIEIVKLRGTNYETAKVYSSLINIFSINESDIIYRESNLNLTLTQTLPINDFQLSYFDVNGQFVKNIGYQASYEIDSYDQFYKPNEVHQIHGLHRVFMRDYDDGKVVAIIDNCNLNECAYTSFETNNHGGWTYSGDASEDIYINHNGFNLPLAKTGEHSKEIGNTIISKNIIPGKYSMNFWCIGTPEVTTSSNNCSIELIYSDNVLDALQWRYFEYIINNESQSNIALSLSTNTTCRIDELRIHPYDAQMQSICYNQIGNVTTECDINSNPTHYLYDNNHRLQFTLDQDWQLRTNNEYSFKEQSDPNDLSRFTSRTALEKDVTRSQVLNDFDYNNPDLLTTSSFFDGLGRMVQQIGINQSASNGGIENDIIVFQEFNEKGFSSINYLPYVHSNSVHSFRSHTIDEQSDFYQNTAWVKQNDYPFAEIKTENSPLLRILEIGAEGYDWQLGRNTTKYEFNFNHNNEVLNWVVEGTGNGATAGSIAPIYLAENTLSKQTIIDEDGNATLYYYDKSNRLILKRNKIHSYKTGTSRSYTTDLTNGSFLSQDQIPQGSANRNVDTYFVYDPFGNLRYELTPGFVEYCQDIDSYSFAESNGNLSEAFNELVFAFHYDELGRLIEKKEPGVGWSYFIYNKLNQLVLTKDANQSSSGENKWSYYAYDILGRLVYSANAEWSGTVNNARTTWGSLESNLWQELTSEANSIFGYTNNLFINSFHEIYDVFFYDNYDHGFNSIVYDGTQLKSERCKGLITSAYSNVFNLQDTHLGKSLFYDHYGQILQIFEETIDGGHEIVDFEYEFTGLLSSSIKRHQLNNTNFTNELTFVNRYSYDRIGRLVAIYQKTENDPEVLIAKFIYNSLGQTIKEHMHIPEGQNQGMQIVDFRYNERGWLSKINNSDLVDDGDNLEDYDIFGEEIFYGNGDLSSTTGYSHPDAIKPMARHNGTISAIKWAHKAPSDQPEIVNENTYVYRYDDLNRMTCAAYALEYKTLFGPMYGQFLDRRNHYLEKFNFDIDGNSTSITRNCSNASNTAAVTIDKLTMKYKNSGRSHLLEMVFDNSDYTTTNNNQTHFRDAANQSNEYEYDYNGSIVRDINKMMKYDYNSLNLTNHISDLTTGNSCQIYHDSRGNKLKKICGNNVWYYSKGLEYYSSDGGNTINFIKSNTANGCVRPKLSSENNTTEFIYDYYLKDHLGNVRSVITEGNAIDVVVKATMELEKAQLEEDMFEYVPDTRHQISPAYPTITPVDSKVSSLSINSNTQGPSRLFIVERSDEVELTVKSWFEDELQFNSETLNLTSILESILLNITNSSTSLFSNQEFNGFADLGNPDSQLSQAVNNFATQNLNASDFSLPQGYLVYMFFDEKFNLQIEYSGVLKVSTPNEIETLESPIIKIPFKGYFYTYLTNYSFKKVDFNDFTIRHKQGVIKGVYDYYPFGLMWSEPDITSNYKDTYQAKEWQHNEFGQRGLELFDFKARLYDPVLGRWNSQDPLQQYNSPYVGMGNNPVSLIDPNGMAAVPPIFGKLGTWFRVNVLHNGPGGQSYGNPAWETIGPIMGTIGGLVTTMQQNAQARTNMALQVSDVAQATANNFVEGSMYEFAVNLNTMSVQKIQGAGQTTLIHWHFFVGPATGEFGNYIKDNYIGTTTEYPLSGQLEFALAPDAAEKGYTASTSFDPLSISSREEWAKIAVQFQYLGGFVETYTNIVVTGTEILLTGGTSTAIRKEGAYLFLKYGDELAEAAPVVVREVTETAATQAAKTSTRFVSTAEGVVHDLKPTLDRIASGGKFPHRNDGSIFKNMEGLLPKQNAGYYKEFVHPTPGVNGPGAMRVVTGQGGEMWFTPDHYKTFIPIR